MRLVRILSQRLRSLALRSRAEAELNSEISLHLEQLTREHMAAGLSRSEAREAALREFGPVSVTQEACRDTRRVNFIDDLIKDLAYAFRALRKSPGFAIAAIASLGLGIGANTAIYGLVQQVVFQLLPVRDPENIVRLSHSNLRQSDATSFSYPVFRDLQTSANLPFKGFLAFTKMGQATMLTESGAEAVAAELVSGNYFELLGVPPARGRLLTAHDDLTPGAHPVAVLSHNYWIRRFGGDSSIINKSVRINGYPFTIVGVSAPGFDGLDPGSAPDVQIPINMTKEVGYSPTAQSVLKLNGSQWLAIFGRLDPGASREQAGTALLPIFLRNYPFGDRFRLTPEGARVFASERVQVMRGAQGMGAARQRFESALWALLATAGVVLLLTTANIAQLLLARAAARTREMSVRAAIGASRTRLLRQLVTESLLLAVLGGVMGVAIANGFGRVLLNMVVSDPAHSTLTIQPNAGMLAFNFGVSVIVGLLFGLVPALRASRPTLFQDLKGRFTGGPDRLLGRKLLVGFQAGLTLVLLVGAGLFLRTVHGLRSLDLGLRPDHVIQFVLDPAGYAPERVHGFFAEVERRLAVVPGVDAVAISRQRSFQGRWSSGIAVEGYTAREGEPIPLRDVVGSGYFAALGIPLIAGREFTASEVAGAAKVAVVNEAFANAYYGNQNPIGKRIGPGGQSADYVIVGLAKNSKYASIREDTQRFWYAPYTTLTPRMHAYAVSVRTTQAPGAMLSAIRSALAGIDRSIAILDPRTLEARISENLMVERLLATLSVLFGCLAALLAAIGLFGVLSYSVSQREREIGIRIALGARPGEIAWTMVRDVILYACLGLTAGLVAAFGLSRFIQKLLFGIRPNDPLAIAGACCVLLAVAAIAVFLPARRAASVDPAAAFRAE